MVSLLAFWMIWMIKSLKYIFEGVQKLERTGSEHSELGRLFQTLGLE